jgi:F-type H+-transporting ATPase subunit a
VNFFTIHRILPLPVNTGFSVSGVTQFISLFMRLLQYWTMLCLLLGMSAMDLSAADSDHGVAEVTSTTELHALASGESHDQAHGEGEHHGLPPSAVPVFHLGPLVITNSMVATILVAAIIIFAAQRATRTVRAVPTGGQNFFEWLVEGLFGFLEGIMGAELVKKTFWFFASLFLFILATNWFGLIPGIGTIGWETSDGHFEPWLRGAQADLNMTSAMAVAFFVLWTVWALQANGVKGLYNHIFGNKGGGAGFMKWFLIAIFFFVGILEVVSILFRPVSLSFRLFGNVFAGENILESMLMIKGLGWIIPLPFYFLELLVGLIQAMVFMLLTAVFTLLICQHHDEDHGEAH